MHAESIAAVGLHPGAGRSGRAVPRGPASYTINYHISPVYGTGGQGHGETEEMHRC